MQLLLSLWLLCGLGVMGWGSAAWAAEPLTARSGPNTVALIELYTSEGCNSCPPADTWIRSLPQRGFTPDRVVPLALHVDYWDYLGWPDRFAQGLFTQRQRSISTRHRSRTIYTPQLIFQGEDFRSWRSLDERLQDINATAAQADLRLYVTMEAPTRLEIIAEATVPEVSNRQHAQLHVALYENHLSSEVTAGENSGRTLQHDYVVRRWFGPFEVNTQGLAMLQRTLPLEREWQTTNLGVAMFVQNHHSGEVLQALALPLTGAHGKGN